jgi:hypothetical protein
MNLRGGERIEVSGESPFIPSAPLLEPVSVSQLFSGRVSEMLLQPDEQKKYGQLRIRLRSIF